MYLRGERHGLITGCANLGLNFDSLAGGSITWEPQCTRCGERHGLITGCANLGLNFDSLAGGSITWEPQCTRCGERHSLLTGCMGSLNPVHMNQMENTALKFSFPVGRGLAFRSAGSAYEVGLDQAEHKSN